MKKKALSIITAVIMLMTYMMAPNVTAYAANISLSASASSVQIGDSVTVTVSIPENVTGPINISLSSDVLAFSSSTAKEPGVNGRYISLSMGKYGLEGTNSVTLTFKAQTSGSVTISASHGDVFDNDTFEPVQLGAASTTITVANKVTDTGNGGGTTTEPQKSEDNSLSSLKLSSGTLSPSFKYNVTKYTATVGYDVTKVVVSAKTSNEKATIESVTGDGTVNLNVGENTIKIVVKAENGVKATYTIVVTRKAQEATVTPEPSEPDSEPETTTPEVNEVLQYNGEQLQITETIPTEVIPTGFESQLLVVNGQQMQGLSFTKGDLKVLYLNNTNGAGSLYVYDEAQQTIYPFVKLTSEKSYVMVLLPDEKNTPAPAGFESCTLSIEGKGVVNAYQLKEKTRAGQVKGEEFYLIYCMNGDGEIGWYMYDSVEETFQRYFVASVQTGGEVLEDSDLQSKYAALEKELNTAKMTQYIIIVIAAALVLILIVVIVLLVMKNRSKEEEFFDEYEDDEDESEEVVEEAAVKEIVVEEIVQPEIVEEEDDEIEIEFYEMEDPTSKLSSKKEDDSDLEFIDFE